MKALMMGAGHYEMAPLSDFTVTETKHAKPGSLPFMEWGEWRTKVDWPDNDYEIDATVTPIRVKMSANRPTDFNVQFEGDEADKYELIWADD